MNFPENIYGWGSGRVPMPREPQNGNRTKGAPFFIFNIFRNDFPWFPAMIVFIVCAGIMALIAIAGANICPDQKPDRIDIAAVMLEKPELPETVKAPPIEKKTESKPPPKKKKKPVKNKKPASRKTPAKKNPNPKKNTAPPVESKKQAVPQRNYSSSQIPVAPVDAKTKSSVIEKTDLPSLELDHYRNYHASNAQIENRGKISDASVSDAFGFRNSRSSVDPGANPGKRYSGIANAIPGGAASPVAREGRPFFSGKSDAPAGIPESGFQSGRHFGESGNRLAGAAGSSGNIGISGSGPHDAAELAGLDEFGVCVDPEEEFRLKTKLAERLGEPARCESGGLVFFMKYVETGYTLHLEVYNPEKVRLKDRCAVLRKAVDCLEPDS